MSEGYFLSDTVIAGLFIVAVSFGLRYCKNNERNHTATDTGINQDDNICLHYHPAASGFAGIPACPFG